MKRTQVYFSEATIEIIKREAKENNTTMAAVIREKVEKETKKPAEKGINDALKAVKEISNLRLPTMHPAKMKEILAESHGRTYDILSGR
ncbi:MAG: CopG family transcriptional regulator [Candidatus Woykebacteria bacterium]